MGRIVYIKNISKGAGEKNKKFTGGLRRLIAIIAAIYMSVIFFAKADIKEKAGDLLYNLAMAGMEKEYILMSYEKSQNKNFNVTDGLIELLNGQVSYIGYVKGTKESNPLISDQRVLLSRDIDKKISETEVLEVKEKEKAEKTEDEVEKKTSGDETKECTVGSMTLSENADGIVYSMEQLNDFNFLISNLYIIPERASVLESELDAGKLLAMDMSIDKDKSVPQILIYHTHSMEGFTDSVEGDMDTGIVEVGNELSEILSEVYGYNVIHCTKSFDYINGKLDRSKAYTYARETLEQILADNPTIEVVIDVHRDGVSEDLHLVTDVNGKQTANIMFFNGVSRTSKGGDIDYLYNKYKLENLAFSLQLKLLAEQYFPGFTRKNYIDCYQYNLDLRQRSVLVEVGAQTNSLSEAKNAMEPLAALLDRLLSENGGV